MSGAGPAAGGPASPAGGPPRVPLRRSGPAGQRRGPAIVTLPAAVRQAALCVERPTYLYHLAGLARHAAAVRAALPGGVELLYAMKANPDARLLAVLARHVTGVEVASAGELAHLARCRPGEPAAAFGGPGKTGADLAAGLAAGVLRFHVESPAELAQLDAVARARGRVADVLLRVDPPATAALIAAGRATSGRPGDRPDPADERPGLSPGRSGGAPTDGVGDPGPGGLVMGGGPSPFGMDPAAAAQAARMLPALPGVRFRGVHAHLASGLAAPAAAAAAGAVTRWAVRFARRHGLDLTEIDVGGGMAVDYARPDTRFDWAGYGTALDTLCRAYPQVVFRIEPGRSLVAYCGYYATPVLDVKRSHGRWFAVLAGGTHHLRTPAAKGHDQPLAVLRRQGPIGHRDGATTGVAPVTLVGQLCTPKDVLARDCPRPVAPGDIVVFAMAGGYAWNISHHDFLMHPHPDVRHLG